MSFFYKTRGAVSIFLVIILVPMVTISAIFVDVGKVHLARGLAESAGDLALNTALTNYDANLKELYGLLATAQNTDDLFSRLEQYYTDCITSSGLHEETAKTYAEQIMAELGVVSATSDVSDILHMQLTDFSAQKYPNANLANAAMLEKEVIEFMKYRAPINLGLKFISALQSFSNLAKQTELIEKKQAYYEAQKGVMEHLRDAWADIAAYNGTKVGSDRNYLAEVKKFMEEDLTNEGGWDYTDEYGPWHVRSFKDIHTHMVMDLYKATETDDQGKKTLLLFPYQVSIRTSAEQELKYNIPHFAPEDPAWGYLDNLVRVYHYGTYDSVIEYCEPYQVLVPSSEVLPSVGDIEAAINSFYLVYRSVKELEDEGRAPGSPKAGDYELQFYLQASRGDLSKYCDRLVKLYSAYHKLWAMMIWIDGYDKLVFPRTLDGETLTAETIRQRDYECVAKGASKEKRTIAAWWTMIQSDYWPMQDKLRQTTDRFNGIRERVYSTWYNPYAEISTHELPEISKHAKGYLDELTAAKDHLTNAISDLNAAKTALSGDVANKKEEWETSANDKSINGTSMAKQDQAEISQLDNNLTPEKIQTLIDRLTHVRDKLEVVISEVKEYTYYGTFVGDLYYYDDLEKLLEEKQGDADMKSVPVNETSLRSTATSWWIKNWHTSEKGIETDWTKDSGYQPFLVENKVALYNYLSSHFGSSVAPTESETSANSSVREEDKENGEDYYNNLKSTGKSEADSQKKNADKGQLAGEGTGEVKDISNRPSAGATGKDVPKGSTETDPEKASGTSSGGLSSLFGDGFMSAISNMAEGLRDNLYFTDYIMSMFSYDTIENEFIEKSKSTNNPKTSVSPGDIKSLTNNDISAANNLAYGAEVEYIIYGGSNAGNIAAAYATIYAIRFGFNVVYAFATSEIRESALAIATPISAATLGIIPAPLIQAIIIIALACMESAIDLYDLSQGKAIPLYKSSDTWTCSLSGLANKAADEAKAKAGVAIKKVSSNAIDAGLNKLNDLLDMTDEELSEAIQNGTEDVEATVNQAYDQLITENANAAIQQLTTLVNEAIDNVRLEVEKDYNTAREEAKAWVRQKMTEWQNDQTGDDFASKVKRQAAQIILDNSDTFIENLFKAVENSIYKAAESPDSNYDDAIQNVLSGSGVEEVGGEIMTQIKMIRSQIDSQIRSAGNEVMQAKDQMISEVHDAMENGADDLKNTLNSQIDGFFGTDVGDGSGTGTASFFSFAYSDYLRLFLIIGFIAGEEKIVLRTADVIQANMAKATGKEGYLLSKAATYVSVEADMLVKPTFFGMPLFSDMETNPADDTSWYTVHYSGVAGY